MLLPLWESSQASIKRWLADDFPEWVGVCIAWRARYLGFDIGPGGASQCWRAAIAKYESRSRQVASLRLGMHISARTYRTLCFSALSFLWQLEDLPEELGRVEQSVLRLLAPGPGNWITPTILHHLQDQFFHPFSFPSAPLTALAAKLRVLEFEPHLCAEERVGQLDAWRAWPLYRHTAWNGWYENSFVRVLLRARAVASDLGVTSGTVRASVASRALNEPARRRLFQQRAYALCLRATRVDVEHVIRSKLSRFRINDPPPGILARRACSRLELCFSLVTPRVAIVLLRSWWNGWCTARRFQNRDARCLFGCSDSAEDSIEHYCRCNVVVDFARSRLRLPMRISGSMRSFLVLDSLCSNDELTLQLLLLYACYSATNVLRHQQANSANMQHNYQELLQQLAVQGTFNHPCSQRVLRHSLSGSRPPSANSLPSARRLRS